MQAKLSVLTVLLICALPIWSLGQRFVGFDLRQDTPEAREGVRDRVDLKPLTEEYYQLIKTRFWPLKVQDIEKIFGPEIEEHALASTFHLVNDLALPLFEPNFIGLSGWVVSNDRSRRVLHAVGDIGYAEFFYQRDGETVAWVAFYARTNEEFVPLKMPAALPLTVAVSRDAAEDNSSKRLEWDEAQFTAFRRWVDEHLPKLTDLGEVDVSESSPSRVNLGGGQVYILKTQILHHPDVTHLWFEIELLKETASASEREKSRQYRSIDHAGQSVGFAIDGKFYRLTPKLVK